MKWMHIRARPWTFFGEGLPLQKKSMTGRHHSPSQRMKKEKRSASLELSRRLNQPTCLSDTGYHKSERNWKRNLDLLVERVPWISCAGKLLWPGCPPVEKRRMSIHDIHHHFFRWIHRSVFLTNTLNYFAVPRIQCRVRHRSWKHKQASVVLYNIRDPPAHGKQITSRSEFLTDKKQVSHS